ncbi:MAG TPA: dTMP kinase [Syntrophomonadaceae bacterium]|nr:dTMP kinase [Syntrophomonadaceae bacterium]
MRQPGKLITFEGPDGAGKTTQVNLTAAALREEGYDVLVTREPGGTRLSEAIRGILLDPAFKEMTPFAEALLYAASRAQLVGEVVLPALGSGRVVLCDRFVDSSLAYQGYGRGLDLEMLRRINAPALRGIGAFLTILLDLEPGEGLRRAAKPEKMDRLEQEDLSFHRRVRDGYLALANQNPERIKVVRAEGDPAGVQAGVMAYVSGFLRGRLQGAPFEIEVRG